MSGSGGVAWARFLFDQHVNARAMRVLRERGVDVVHVGEAGLTRADDPEIFVWAKGASRLIVTRNHRDFAPLARLYATNGEDFPGVLFYAASIRESDVGGHVRALERWIERARTLGRNPARNGWDWLG